MKQRIVAEIAGEPRSDQAKSIAIMYAVILVVMVVAQLFSFEKFLLLVTSFWLPGGQGFAYFLAAFIVICEVFALPFLLRMRLSLLMRVVSMICSWIVPVIWLTISVWLNSTINAVQNVGFLGDVVELVPGWWAVGMSLALGVLAVWSSWGLWPFRQKI